MSTYPIPAPFAADRDKAMPIQVDGELGLADRRGERGLILVRSLPWEMFGTEAEKQCQANHSGQTLDRIRERGGFGAGEAVRVLAGFGWNSPEEQKVTIPARQAHLILFAMRSQFLRVPALVPGGDRNAAPVFDRAGNLYGAPPPGWTGCDDKDCLPECSLGRGHCERMARAAAAADEAGS